MRTERLRRARAWALCALACGLVATGGCLDLGGNDDENTPDAGNSAIDNEVAWGTAGNAVDATNALVENLNDWMQNGIGGTGRAQTSTWDPVAEQWTVSGNEDYDDGDATGSVTYTYVVRFSADGVAQAQPDDFTDQIDVTLDATNAGNYHPEGENWTIDYDWTAHEVATANGLPEGGGTLVGTGSVTGSTLAHIGEASIPATQDMTWEADLVLPDQGCATGTVSGEMLPWSFATVLDGSDEMVVSLFYLGDFVTSETRSAPCGVAAGASGAQTDLR